MSNYFENMLKSVAGAAAALVVTWVMSYGFVSATSHVHGSAASSVLVAAVRN
jgi:hypothetical protein